MNFPDDDIAKLKELISEAYQAVNKRAVPRRTERRRPNRELKRASERLRQATNLINDVESIQPHPLRP